MKKSQISVEFLFVFIVIVIMVIILILYMGNRRIEFREIEEYVDKRAECLRISAILSSVYSNGDGTSSETSTNYLITVFNTSIVSVKTSSIDDSPVSCSYVGKTDFYEDLTGILSVRNNNGILVLQNDTS